MSGGVGRMARSHSSDIGSRMNSIVSYEEQNGSPNMKKHKMNVGGNPGVGEDEE